MVALRFAVHAIIGQIGIQVLCKTNADRDSDGNVNANVITMEMESKICCTFVVRKNSLSSSQIASKGRQIVTRMSSDRIWNIHFGCICCIYQYTHDRLVVSDNCQLLLPMIVDQVQY